jgi:GntR family transcriptional regulator
VPPGNSRYPQIAAHLHARILAGEWPPGSTLPTLDDLTAEYGADKNTVSRAISDVLEPEGLVWAVPKRGTIVRHGMARQHRPRGDVVKRDTVSSGPGYIWPPASGQEAWRHHVPATAQLKELADRRIASLLQVAAETEILMIHQVTGPAAEPPVQVGNSWIHPRVASVAGATEGASGLTADWVDRIEKAGHGPLSWTEYGRARLPTRKEATELQVPITMPVMEIVRVGCSGLDGGPVEVTEYVIPSDRVEVVREVHRGEVTSLPWPEGSAGGNED